MVWEKKKMKKWDTQRLISRSSIIRMGRIVKSRTNRRHYGNTMTLKGSRCLASRPKHKPMSIKSETEAALWLVCILIRYMFALRKILEYEWRVFEVDSNIYFGLEKSLFLFCLHRYHLSLPSTSSDILRREPLPVSVDESERRRKKTWEEESQKSVNTRSINHFLSPAIITLFIPLRNTHFNI